MATWDHQKLVDEILVALSSTSRCRVWKNVTGKGRALHNPEYVIAFGLVGSADITGLRNDGKRIEIEVKTGKAVQTKEQRNFQAMISKFNGIYCVARSVNDAMYSVFPDLQRL